ncbi:hypothetical protein [Paenibacillus sp. FSL R7-0337]|uniref:hypothetical protein n=1 Tax=Paenibacillus sp. FSL R7-0337 TaxID=1926588 RepID=UPI00096BFE6E|nr:hypothetical protein [Paenibacillus sp. FSL R7-0337]OMF90374.1 hypothetical protein BK147_23590 [Paenibacillus sp. FSL R7-0337]
MNRQQLNKKVGEIVKKLIAGKGVVTPLKVFLRLGAVSPEQVEEWRLGKVPYLERVLRGNLSQFNFILSLIRQKAREHELKPSHTDYVKRGKGPKRPLRFSKTGDVAMEQRYSTHYVTTNPAPAETEKSSGNAAANIEANIEAQMLNSGT